MKVPLNELLEENTVVIQAEFNLQNTNYLSVLLHSKENGHSFKVLSLDQQGMPCELNFQIDDLMPKAHAYGQFNHDLRIVGFTQSS